MLTAFLIGRIELGYKLSEAQLNYSDADLDNLVHTTSIKSLVTISGANLSTLIRGPANGANPSLGSVMYQTI